MSAKFSQPLSAAAIHRAASHIDWFAALPDDGLIREQQIVASPKNKAPLINVSASTWWRMVRAKLAPQPIRLSPGCTVWRVGELRSWLKGLK